MIDQDPTVEPLGEYLRTRRQLKGSTLRSLGGNALSSSYLSNVETGKIKDITVSSLIALAGAYEVPVATLLRDVYGVDSDSEQSRNDEALAIGSAVQALPEHVRERTIEWINYQAEKSQAGASIETQ